MSRNLDVSAQRFILASALVASCCVAAATAANAATITTFDVLSTFNFIENKGVNDGGYASGVFITTGINVTPVGTQPTPSANGTSVTATQGSTTVSVPYFFSSANPDEFVKSLLYSTHTALTGSWTFNLTNPTINGGLPVASSPNPPLATTTPPPFVTNVLLTPNGTTPQLQWAVPNGYTPSAQSLYIYDNMNKTPNGVATLIYANNNIGLATNFTVPSGLLNSTSNYLISIQLDQTNSALSSPENLQGRSRTFANFNAGSFGTSTTPVYIPTITPGNVSQFNIAVVPGQTYNIDPTVATGFTYAIGNGNPNFATVLLPDLQGSEPYMITWDNGLDTEQLIGGDLFNFLLTDPLGVSAFTVTGIDPADGVDPSSGTDFVTGLTFVGAGSFTGSMTPITANVAEPSSLALLGAGVAGFVLIRRRCKPA